ncbi:hypothetical protein PSEUBRA_004883 [Kalmanozyma brasiliensis GHG001]|uniref:uncharacterized protein n=1 Tax=Kalmanozyma brasiliensis (strain GHG001) TaxID=1365824 RepID=UPI002867C4CC|nr:uncharacterized protein PSEUBRA_004883 [Kalmanozyma brasiliensis GHG001]KAF6767448.1 hypothetical protein PSEUBRA_004883 [Kalmanozyma brasiliensis GHG001]
MSSSPRPNSSVIDENAAADQPGSDKMPVATLAAPPLREPLLSAPVLQEAVCLLARLSSASNAYAEKDIMARDVLLDALAIGKLSGSDADSAKPVSIATPRPDCSSASGAIKVDRKTNVDPEHAVSSDAAGLSFAVGSQVKSERQKTLNDVSSLVYRALKGMVELLSPRTPNAYVEYQSMRPEFKDLETRAYVLHNLLVQMNNKLK